MANTWHGNFPNENKCEDDFGRTLPVLSFPPNGYGLYDMIGNVWEWTTDWWSAKRSADTCDPSQPQIKIPCKVIKGVSHLFAPNCCRRYSSMSLLGFRCVLHRRDKQHDDVDGGLP